jgi:hypothetical protein
VYRKLKKSAILGQTSSANGSVILEQREYWFSIYTYKHILNCVQHAVCHVDVCVSYKVYVNEKISAYLWAIPKEWINSQLNEYPLIFEIVCKVLKYDLAFL